MPLDRQHRLSFPTPDLGVHHMRYADRDQQNDIVYFYIKNDDPEHAVKFTLVECHMREGEAIEVLVGYYPPLPEDNAGTQYCIGRTSDPQTQPLHEWLGVNTRSLIPLIGFDYTSDDDFKRRGGGDTQWLEQPDLMGNSQNDRNEWLDNMREDLFSRFSNLELPYECSEHTQRIMEEVFERIKRREPLTLNEAYLRGVLKGEGRGRGMGEEEDVE